MKLLAILPLLLILLTSVAIAAPTDGSLAPAAHVAISNPDHFPQESIIDKGKHIIGIKTPATAFTDDSAPITITDNGDSISITSDTSELHNIQIPYDTIAPYITDGYVKITDNSSQLTYDTPGISWHQKVVSVDGFAYIEQINCQDITIQADDLNTVYGLRLSQLKNTSVEQSPELGLYSQSDFSNEVQGNASLAIQESDEIIANVVEDGKINITSTGEDSLHTIRIPWDEISPLVNEGKVVINHLNDTGFVDFARPVEVQNDGGYAYIQDMPFSSLTINPYGVPDAFVTNMGNTTVFQMNTTTDTCVRSITVGTAPAGVAVSRDGTRAYIVNSGSSTMSVINTSTGSVVATVNTGAGPLGVCVTPDGKKIYVGNSETNTITVVWAVNNTVKTTIAAVGNYPTGMVASPNGTYIYASNDIASGTVKVINTASDTIAYTISSMGSKPYGLAITPDGTKLYVSDENANTIKVVWTANNSLKATITGPSGYKYWGIAATPDGAKVYAANSYSDTVSIITVSSDTIAKNLAVGTTPCGVSATYDSAYVYITNQDGNTLSKITTSSDTVTKTIGGFLTPTSLGIMDRQTPVPSAKFTTNVTSGTVPFTVSFTDTSTGSPTTWDWDYGDSTTHGTTKNPTHQYTVAGTYTIVFNASSISGYSVNTSTNWITANSGGGGSPPVVDFSANVTTGVCPKTIAFTDSSTNTPTSWAWNFGDGTVNVTGTGTPTHTYSNVGVYTVALTATNADGSGSLAKTNYINITPATAGSQQKGVWDNGNTSQNYTYWTTAAQNVGGNNGVVDMVVGVAWADDVCHFKFPGSSSGYYDYAATDEVDQYMQAFSNSGKKVILAIQPGKTDVTTAIDKVLTQYNKYNSSIIGVEIDLEWKTSGTANHFNNTERDNAINKIQSYNSSYKLFLTDYNTYDFLPSDNQSMVVLYDGSGQGVTTQTTLLNDYYAPLSSHFSNVGMFTGYSSNIPTRLASDSSIIAAAPNTQYIIDTEYDYDQSPISGVAIPIADFSGSSTTIETGQSVTFTDSSTGIPTDWAWNFGDTGTSTLQNPTHQYNAVGTYTVSLTSSNGNGGNTSTKTNYITVSNPTVVASFTTNVSGGNVPLTVAFTDTSSNTPTAWDWNFGDGSSHSNVQNPTHTYTNIGIYNVTLNASNADGYSIFVNNSCITAGVIVSRTNVSYGNGNAYVQNTGTTTVSVLNTATNTITNTITGFNTPSVSAITPDCTKLYVTTNVAGSNVLVVDTSTNTVTNTISGFTTPLGIAITPDGTKAYVTNNGANNVLVINTNTNTVTNTISGFNTPYYGIAITPDGTKAYVSNTGANNVLVINTSTNTVTNTISGLNAPRGLVISPDGTKVYVSNQGANNVLVINTSTNTVTNTISGFNAPKFIDITPDGTKAYVSNQGANNVLVINTSTNTVTNTISGFSTPQGVAITSDGTTAYVTNYIVSGTVSVINTSTNTVTNTISGFNTPYSVTVRKNKSPISDFTANVTSGTAPLSVQFTDNSINAPTAWNYSFGDGTYSNSQNPVHQYTNTGTYTISQNVSNVAGYSIKTVTGYVTVTSSTPVAAFTKNVTSGTYPLTVAFTDTSTNTPTSWEWNFGDSSSNVTGTGTPTHTFVGVGTFTVTLGASNAGGTTYAQQTVTVNKATPSLSWSPSPTSFVYGNTFTAGQLNANSGGVAGSFAYTYGGNTYVVGQNIAVGSDLVTATFTPTDTANYTSGGTTTATFTVSKATPTFTYSPSPSTITYPTALVSGQLNAACSNTAGSFAYTFGGNTVTAGTIIAAGSDSITATFTPTDSTNYTSGGTTSATITVSKATPSLSWSPSPTSFTFGTSFTSNQLNAASGGVAGSFVYSYGGNNYVVGQLIQAGSPQVTATFTPTDSTNYTSGGTTQQTFTVAKYSPRTTWTNPTAITYPTAISATQLNANANTASYSGGSLAGSFAYNPASGTVLSAGSNTLYTTFSPTDSTNYSTNNTSVTLVVNKLAPTITWNNPSNINYGTALSATQLCATFGGIAGVATYTPASGVVLGAGNSQTLHVSFAPTDSVNYSVVTRDVSINVLKVTPTITWGAITPIVYGTALSGTQLNANVASPAGTITYNQTSGTVLGVGTYTILATFTPTDTANYSTATTTQSLTVNKATPTLTYNNPADITYGTALSSTQLSASCAAPAGTITYNRTSGTVLGVGTYQILATFTPTDTSNYSTVTATATLNVNKATPTITWGAISPITYPTALSGTQLAASCPQTGSFAYNRTAGTVLGVGTYTILVTFTPSGADATNYTTNTATQTLTVNKATSTISWSNPSDINYGTALSGTQLNAVPTPASGTLTYTPASGIVLSAGNGQTLNVSFAPTDSTNYSVATASVSINVLKVTPTITWTDPAAITYGTALSGTQLNPSSGGIAGTYVFNPISGTVLSAGTNQLLQCTFTPTDATNYTTATGSAHITVNKANPTLTWANPADINYGTALSATQLSCTSGGIAGVMTYTPQSGTVLSAGLAQTLHVSFAPTDSTNYSTVTKDVTINVNKASTTITWANPSDITYGTALSGTQLNANVAGVAGTYVYTPVSGTVLSAGNSQTLHVAFTPTDSTNYSSSAKDVTINVGKASTTVTWSNPAAITFGTALSSTQLAASCAQTAGTFTYNPPTGTILAAGSQTLHVDFTPTDSVNYTGSNKDVTLVVNKASTTITWSNPADITFGTALSGTQLNANVAGVAGTYVYTPASGVVLGAGLAQTLHVAFTPTDSTNYSSSTKDVTINVGKASTTVTWTAPNPITYPTALSSTQLSASGSVAGSIIYTPVSGTVLAAGTQNLHADFTPTDTANYTSSSKDVSLTVNKATVTISWTQPSPITYGTALSATQLSATSGGVAGTMTYDPVSGTILSAGTKTLNVSFAPTDTTNYSSATGSTTIVVNKVTPTISWTQPSPINYGVALSGTQLSATSGGIAGTMTYDPIAGTILGAGTKTLNVSFSPTDTTNYTTALGSTTIVVNKLTPTINWNNPSAITFGTALSATQLNADSGGISGSFAYVPTTGTILGAGTKTLNTTFTPSDSTNYTTAVKSVTIVVNKADVTINWNNPAGITFGTALSSTQLNADSGAIAGTFVYTPPTGTVLGAGSQSLRTDFTPTDTANYTNSNKTVTLVVSKASTSLTWSNPSDIVFGVALSGTQLNAASVGGIAGTFVYNPISGTVLSAGAHTLNVTFTPTDSNNYTGSIASVQITVTKAPTTITWSNPGDITYGTTLSGTQLSASASVGGSLVYTPTSGTMLSAGNNQNLRVDFTPTDGTNYSISNKTVTINVLKGTPTITWNTPSSINYGTALSSTQLNAGNSLSIAGTYTYIPQSGTILGAGSQTLNVSFAPTDSTNYSSCIGSVQITVNKAATDITWNNPSDINYGTALSATQLNAVSVGGIAGTFAYIPSSGTVLSSGNNQMLNTTFTPTDSSNYTSSVKTVHINVLKASSAVTWSNPANINYGTALSGTQLNAGNTLGLAGTYVYVPPSGTVLPAGSNTLNVTFNPTDSTNYSSSTGTVQLTVNKATSVVTWTTPSDIINPAPLSGTQLNAQCATTAGSFVYDPISGTILSAGNHQLNTTFTPTDAVNYTSATANVTIHVRNALPTASFSTNHTSGTIPLGIQFTDTSTGTNITQWLWQFGDGTANSTQQSPIHSFTTAGTYNVNLTVTNDGGSSKSGNTQITAGKTTPTITWNNPSAIIYGNPLNATQLNANADTAGSYVYTPAIGAILGAGTQTLHVDFTPTDTTNYTTASKDVSLTVNKNSTSITWSNPTAIGYGTALSATQLNAAGSVAGTIVYTPQSGVVLGAGSQTLHADFTPTDTANYTSSSKDVSLTVNKASVTLTWSNPADITYGTQLSGTQLSATSDGIQGTFVYNPVSGYVMHAGASQTLHVDFTPTDSSNYTTASKDVTINVNKASTSLTWSNPASIGFGTALSNTQLNANCAQTTGTYTYTPPSGTVLGVGSQTLHCDFVPTDSTNYSNSNKDVTIVVTKATSVITWANPAAITYGTALNATQLNANCATTAGSFAYDPSTGAILGAGSKTLNVIFTPTDAVNYTTASASVTLVVNKAATTLAWSNPADITYGTQLSAIQLSATSGGIAGTYTYNPASGYVMHAGNAQTLHVDFSPTDSTNYSTSSKDVTINVLKASSSITWSNPAAINFGTALSGTQLNASPSVAGTIVYNPISGTVLGAGTQTLHADLTPTDSTNYSASSKDVTIVVNKATPTINWNNPSDIGYGTALSATQLNANSGTAGTFSYNPPSGTVLAVGSQTLHTTLTPTDGTNYTTQTKDVTLVVTKATTSITWNNPTAINYGTALSGTQLNAVGSVDGTMSYNPASGVVLAAGSQTLHASFTPTDSTNYSSSTKDVTLVVNKLTPTITWATPDPIDYGTALSSTQLNAGSTTPGTLTYNKTVGMILGAGTQTLGVTLTPTDSTNYTSATASVQLVINKATPTITWNNPSNIVFGTALSATQLNANSGTAGTMTYTPPSGTVLGVGSQTLHVSLAPTDSNNYSSASKDVTIVVTKATPTITWNNPADITYGTALSATQLNAQSGTTGNFVYTPTSGTVISAGNAQTLHVQLNPTDSVNYSTATKDVVINVLKATPTITWANPSNIVYGTALSGTQLCASSGTAGTFTYNPVSGTILGAGDHTLHVDLAPTDSTNYSSASKDVTITVTKNTTSVTWSNPADITYPTPLSGSQLNAQGSVVGTLTYNPVSGTVLAVGTHTLHVDFAPTDSANYSSSSKDVSITVIQPAPVADFSGNVTSGYKPLTVLFTDNSTNTPTAWQYDFGDSSPNGTTANPTHTYTTAGTYTVTLTATNAGGNGVKVRTNYITVSVHPPIASFSQNKTAGNAQLDVGFTDTSQYVGAYASATYQFSFGDGTANSTSASPVHTYSTNGSFVPMMTVTTAGGSSTYTGQTIVITHGTPVANFTSNITTGSMPQGVQFTDLSTGDIDNWVWNFGDGLGSAEQSPIHIYQNAGTYTVSLNVTNVDGFNKTIKTNYIHIYNNAPVANFTQNTTSGMIPLTVQFTDLSTNSPENWTWNFGDGKGTYTQSPMHTYDAIGTYSVNLTVSNDGGQTFLNITDLIHVVPYVTTPIADFTSDTQGGTPPLTVHFTDNSSNSPTSWIWDFGDGNTSTEQNPIHIYPIKGSYSVSLNATNSMGSNAKVMMNYITVSEMPVANFTSNATEGVIPFNVQFTDNSTGTTATNWLWDFGDSHTSTEQNPIHSYNTTGYYNVTLTVNNTIGNSTVTMPNYIHAMNIPIGPPIPQFYADNTTFVYPYGNDITSVAVFHDTSVANPDVSAWEWTFGDGNTSTEQNTVHIYNNTGLYDVSLKVTNSQGANTVTKNGYINITMLPPVPDFMMNRSVGYMPMTVQFIDSTTNWHGNETWDFGDGNNSTVHNPTHEFMLDGIYHVTLTLEYNNINYTVAKDVTVKYVTLGTMTLSAVEKDDLATVNATNVTGIRVTQLSSQAPLYSGGKSIIDAINSGYGLFALGIFILGAILVLRALGYL